MNSQSNSNVYRNCALLSMCATLAIACGDEGGSMVVPDGGGNGPDSALPTIDAGPLGTSLSDFQQELFVLECEDKCFDVGQFFDSVEDCAAFLPGTFPFGVVSTFGDGEALQAAVDNGLVTYDPIAATECLAARRDLPCEARVFRRGASHGFTLGLVENECAGVFTGSIALGEDCLVDEACVGGGIFQTADCYQTDEDICSVGVCTAKGVAGDACDDFPFCQSGFQCEDDVCVAEIPDGGACTELEDGSSLCRAGRVCLDNDTCGIAPAMVALGEACFISNQCPDSASCRQPEVDATHVCIAALAEGDPCVNSGGPFGGPTTGGICGQGLACEGELAAVCVVAPAEVGTGESCATADCQGATLGIRFCDTTLDEPICRDAGDVGEPCGVPDFFRTNCVGGLSCVDGQCLQPKASGSCMNNGECLSFSCVDMMCEEYCPQP